MKIDLDEVKEAFSCNLDIMSTIVMQGVRKLLEYLTPLGQKRDVSESDEQTSEASVSEVAYHIRAPLLYCHVHYDNRGSISSYTSLPSPLDQQSQSLKTIVFNA